MEYGALHLRLRDQHPIERIVMMPWQRFCALRMLKANAKLFNARLATEPNYLFRRDGYRLRFD